MSNLLYLFIAVVLSGLGWMFIWLRHRQPTSMEFGIDEFNRELKALAPERPPGRDDRVGFGG